MEAVPARGNDGILKLQNHVVRESRGIGHVSRGAAHSRDQPVVGVHMHLNLVR